ncbi:MAG TPA: hypothetical protein VG838_06800 [Opitutaceae bacterium]|nr:hypothetical protein [Lacunisphaera sp.]HWA09139.1 hypothetical protein [Opitutaceae bacterium]
MDTPAPSSRSLGEADAIGYLGTALVAAFVMCWHWELAQTPAFRNLAHLSWARIVGRDLVAACGDVGMILFGYWIGVVWTENKRWPWPGSVKTYAFLAALGFVFSVVAERLALRYGRSTYSELMPLIPGLGVGALPVLQLTVLAPLAFAFANARQHRKDKPHLAQPIAGDHTTETF